MKVMWDKLYIVFSSDFFIELVVIIEWNFLFFVIGGKVYVFDFVISLYDIYIFVYVFW